MMPFLTYLFLLLHLFKSPFSCSPMSFLSTSLPFFSFVGSSTFSLSLSPVCLSTSLNQIKHLWTLASTQQPALSKAWPSPEVCSSALLNNHNFHFLDVYAFFLLTLPPLVLILHSVSSPQPFPTSPHCLSVYDHI